MLLLDIDCFPLHNFTAMISSFSSDTFLFSYFFFPDLGVSNEFHIVCLLVYEQALCVSEGEGCQQNEPGDKYKGKKQPNSVVS